ncbi:DUF2157 domain-containing protein [Pontiella sp.]|uniref:DUF2157 domain-containing protein n=1 Tax=Pontiella sp. TaxID=2837462 RepID=UPI003566E77A
MRKVSARNLQWLEKELPILEREGILAADAVRGIRSYYRENTGGGLHWATLAFAVLGSLLIGAGIILLFAHNWDELDRPTRAVLSFCPVAIGAILSVLAVVRHGGVARRESAGIFHSLAVGSSIALIGQTYHIPGNVPGFLLSWSLLILPLAFLLGSTGAFLIYLGLICGWSGVAQDHYGQAAAFWLLLAPALVKVWAMVRVDRNAPDTLLSVYGILFTLAISTGIVFERTVPGLWIVAYSALLSAAALLGLNLYRDREGWSNPPKTFGIIGIALLAYLFTWSDMWRDIGWQWTRNGWHYRTWGTWADATIALALLAGWIAAAIQSFRRNSIETIALAAFPAIATLCFFIGAASGDQSNGINAVIFNAFLLFYGVLYIVLGCRNTKLRQLNGGMAILSLLLVTRFFDDDFGFLARGIVFIALGACFLTVNLIMARRKKTLEATS